MNDFRFTFRQLSVNCLNRPGFTGPIVLEQFLFVEDYCSKHEPAFYRVTRDLHLYFGLFISPFILVFAISVFFLVHRLSPKATIATRSAISNLSLPTDLENLSGRPLVDRLIPVLKENGIEGELGWVQHFPKEHRFVIPVSVPGRATTGDARR